MSTHASEINRLTASWLERTHGSGVLSGAGVWPLLAILAASADEPGRDDLAEAAHVSPDDAMDAARDVLKVLDDLEGVDAALGLWAQAAARVDPEWRDQLPPGTYGELTGDSGTDQPVLDHWASERTGGLIERFPAQTGPELMLTLATALTARTTWQRKFTDERMTPSTGPWAGQQLAGLKRTTHELDDMRVAATDAGPLTVVRVAGDNGIDVHLTFGDEASGPDQVLPAAVPLVTGQTTSQSGADVLAEGDPDRWPGVTAVPARKASLALQTVRFKVRSEHDLLEHASAFGLQTVSRTDRGHFPAISPVPLHVDQARQSAFATFSATGFEAAAVTAMGLRAVSMPVLGARGLEVTYDRPFGFLAVHRASGLVLFAGWVDTPTPWQPPKPR